ncbi:hypothetical protein [Guptibacillus hwajinpoensis]|uniref:hypothetical protein n=1 Tax=Guptibacillus hwajinpoensis TaxID=208199 RepID=UPI003734EEB8
MRGIPIFVLLGLLLIITGCNNQSADTGSFQAKGQNEQWEVTSEYKVTEKRFSENAVLTYIGEGTPKDVNYEWKFPEEMGKGSLGKFSSLEPGQVTFETATSGGSPKTKKNKLEFYKKHIENTSIVISWRKNGEHKTEIPVKIK